jgi:DNA mismatch repair ATPase MutL
MPLANFTTGRKICSRADCRRAGEEQIVTSFAKDRRSKDGFKSECRECGIRDMSRVSPESKRQYKETAETKIAINAELADKRRAMAHTGALVTIAQRKSHSPLGLAAIAQALVKEAGGEQRLAADYFAVLTDPELAPHHKLRGFQGIFSVIKDNETLNPIKEDPSLWSDTELDDRIRELIQEHANKDAIEVEYVETEPTADPAVDHPAAD